jgi:hypothetical protein
LSTVLYLFGELTSHEVKLPRLGPFVCRLPAKNGLLVLLQLRQIQSTSGVLRDEGSFAKCVDVIHQTVFLTEVFHILQQFIPRDVGEGILKYRIQLIGRSAIEVENVLSLSGILVMLEGCGLFSFGTNHLIGGRGRQVTFFHGVGNIPKITN